MGKIYDYAGHKIQKMRPPHYYGPKKWFIFDAEMNLCRNCKPQNTLREAKRVVDVVNGIKKARRMADEH